ncbi:MAG: beta-ketoacyl synthase N-terminal-like domain-containing protein [Bacteroidales bacterium]|nr:beta-ketoacyl synthase N-terminal-like domain-containing protein [Bacteroidales bacterium]
MTEVYAGAENIITSLGFDTEENIGNIIAGNSGIRTDQSMAYTPGPIPLSLTDRNRLDQNFEAGDNEQYTTLEQLFIQSISKSLQQCRIDISSPGCLFIFTTTKGNIELLNHRVSPDIPRGRINLMEMARQITAYFNHQHSPVIISNACVSGVTGLIYASRMIRSGKVRHVVVSGGDLISEFIVSGFQSFQSLSQKACKPFDKNRDGLTLGEGCGTIILSGEKKVFDDADPIQVLAGAGSNDANHISGPSRTGEGLLIAIRHALELSGLTPRHIDTISAHGTATAYNDEMEAKAFSSAGLGMVPLNSYKGYIGHTLGAAGVIETAISMNALRKNMQFQSMGYEEHGVSQSINIIKDTRSEEINTCLKTASGFGGSNAAVVLQKRS